MPGGAPSGRPRRWLRVLRRTLGALVVIAGLLAGTWIYTERVFNAPGPLPDSATLVVPHGGEEQVAEFLADALVVARPLPFRLATLLTRDEGPLHAGEFAFPAHASLRTVLTVLRTAKPVQHHFTIAEGLTAKQIVASLDRADALVGTVDPPAEGSVLPQTYAYEYGAQRGAVLERARAAMDRALQDAWTARAPDLPLASPRDALILASIVERETAKADERPHVAAVFLNRLRLGMKLQSDPTVVYGASGGSGTLDRPISRADLERDDPYNTYRLRGLPPGPISAPGLASIRAVTQPLRSDDLFFVADGSGGHVFSRTLDEHARNVARWRALTGPPTEIR